MDVQIYLFTMAELVELFPENNNHLHVCILIDESKL